MIEKLERVSRDVNQRNDDLKNDYEYLKQQNKLLEEVKSEEYTLPDSNKCTIDCSNVNFQQSEIENKSAKITVFYTNKNHTKSVLNIGNSRFMKRGYKAYFSPVYWQRSLWKSLQDRGKSRLGGYWQERICRKTDSQTQDGFNGKRIGL